MRAVRSFDVFDTVLTRTVGDPDAVIDIVAARLASTTPSHVPPTVIRAARKRHERRLTELTGLHATLHRIYEEVVAALGLDPSLAAVWARAEEDLERELCVAVPGAHRLVDAARRDAHQVIFISDTPHSEALVRELLTELGLAREEDLVFTSSARGASKSRGGLFEAVAALVGTDHRYVHVGDNRRSDLASARVEGWEGSVLPRARLTRYEELLEEHSSPTSGLTSWLAGSSRLARLEAYERGVTAPVADVASGVMAPFLVGYALWILGQARTRGLQRLYFVARDGEVMLEVARQVIAPLAPDIELRYLHGSRQPWVFGACASSDVILDHWVAGRTDFTARTTLERVGLSPELVHELTGLASTAPGRADLPLAPADRSEMAHVLTTEPLLSMVRAEAGAVAERTTAYLRQEGLLDGTPAALVDAGWSGRAAAGLDQLLVSAGGAPVTHFFVGLLGTAEESDLRRGVDLVPWLFDRQRLPASVAGLHSPNVLIEMLCAGTTGRTVDYAVDATSGRVEPVLDRPHNEAALAWGLAELQQTAIRTSALLTPHLTPDAAHQDSAAYAWDVLTTFWTHPTSSEVSSWGSFPGEEEIWPPFMPLAQRVTGPDMLRRVLRGERTLRRNNTWRAGSARASKQPWRGLLGARAWKEENRARLQRIPRRLRLELAARRSLR